jgi:hypothetical protein
LISRYIGPTLWAAFAIALGAIAHQLLLACDTGSGLFGLRYCQSRAAFSPVGSNLEQERERSLRKRLHEAELRLAQLPACPAPPTQNGPTQVAPPPEILKIPTKVEDLKGCWQSERGDLQIRSDDERAELVGEARICFCLGADGGGEARYLFANGDRCSGPLTAKLTAAQLTMSQGRVQCRSHGFIVPADIVCTQHSEGTASCNTQSLGLTRSSVDNEKYQRVDNSRCEWSE